MRQKFTGKQVNYIVNHYGKISYSDMSKKIGLKIHQIHSIVYKFVKKRFKRGNSPFCHKGKRIFSVDDYVFSEISPTSCYWAGFLAADGNISHNKVTLTIQNRDYIHLQNYSNFLKYTGTIKTYKKNYEYNGKKSIKKCSSLVFTSNKIVDDLSFYFNIVPRKSLILKPPNLTNKNLVDSFIIGYIDGDGSIGLYKCKKLKQKRLSLQIIGTKLMLKWIQSRFEQILNEELNCIYKKGKIFTITTSARRARELILHFDKINNYRLKRKWPHEIINYCKNFKKYWNKDKHDLIMKMLKSGMSRREVADKNKITYQAVSWYKKKFNKSSELDKGEVNIDEVN